ncbi:hypothetical protein Dimus_025187 [Dionaea muscipula]
MEVVDFYRTMLGTEAVTCEEINCEAVGLWPRDAALRGSGRGHVCGFLCSGCDPSRVAPPRAKSLLNARHRSVKGLLHGYDRMGISPRCMAKIDLQKAYDSVD